MHGILKSRKWNQMKKKIGREEISKTVKSTSRKQMKWAANVCIELFLAFSLSLCEHKLVTVRPPLNDGVCCRRQPTSKKRYYPLNSLPSLHFCWYFNIPVFHKERKKGTRIHTHTYIHANKQVFLVFSLLLLLQERQL